MDKNWIIQWIIMKGRESSSKNKSSLEAMSGRKKVKLAVIMLRLAPKFILYAKSMSYKLKKRNSHQLLLFPTSTISLKTEEEGIINQGLIKQYKDNSDGWYGFYFQPNHIFIDNHHLNILQLKQSIPNHLSGTTQGKIIFFGESVNYEGRPCELSQGNNLILMGTDQGQILAVKPSTNSFGFLQVTEDPANSLNSISSYKNHLLGFTKNSIYAVSITNKNNSLELSLIFAQKKLQVSMRRAQFVSKPINTKEVKFYVFYVNETGLWRLTLKSGIFSNVLGVHQLLSSPKLHPFTNLKIYHQISQERIIITATCTKQVVLLSHHLEECKTSVLYRFPNPKNPPMIPKFHIYNCIEYFQSGKFADGQLLIALSFTERVYFIKVWPDYCQISKRIKYRNRILRILNFKNEGVVFVCEKYKNNSQGDQENNKAENKKQVSLIVTRLSQILSFTYPVVTACANSIQLETTIQLPSTVLTYTNVNSENLLVKIVMFENRQILICTDTEIQRVCFNNWKQIYKKMAQTQNIQLLYFLILVSNHESLFFDTPEMRQLQGLQHLFEPTNSTQKQIMLQYYYQTNQNPPIDFISQIQNNNIQLLLPFILFHKIQNLTPVSQEMLIQYFSKKDMRIVEQLIVSGVEHGWQIAVSFGWMRALRKMVQMGMEIHFPLLKISSFMICCLQQLKELQMQQQEEEQNQSDNQSASQNIIEERIEQIKKDIGNYSQQIIDYALLALENFLKPEEIDDIEDLRQFILALLRQDIFVCLIKYRPQQMIKLLSAIFNSSQRITLMQKFQIDQFLNFSKIFKHLASNHKLSISEILYSHISESFREITQQKPTPPNLRLECRHLLFIQHAKLVKLKKEENFDVPIKFTRNYLIEMLYSLCSNDNEDVKILIKDLKLLLNSKKEQIEFYIEQFLVQIWQEAQQSCLKIQAIKTDEKKSKGEEMLYDEIKEVFTTLEQINNTNSNLLIKVMESMSEIDYCTKILKKYLQSNNSIVRARMFDWIFKAIENQAQKKILEVELMRHLSQLIEINKQKSRQVFDILYFNKEKQIIERIDNDPLLQLQYLEMIINDTKDDEKETIQENFLNLHLKLLINQQPQRLIPILEDSIPKNIKYDLHQALKLSNQRPLYPQKNKVQTYLFEKVGDLQKCIKSYLKMLTNLFWSYAQLYETKGEVEKSKSQIKNSQQKNYRNYSFDKNRKSTQKMSLITEILTTKKYDFSNSKLLELEQEICDVFGEMEELIFRQPVKKYDYLVLPLNTMISLLDHINTEQFYHSEHYKAILVYYFGHFITQSFQKGYIRYFIRWMHISEKIDLTIIKKYLIDCYNTVIKQKNLLTSMATLEEGVLVQNITQNLITLQNSVYSDSRCPICEKKFNETEKGPKRRKIKQDALLFNCGHLYHKNCIEEDENGEDYCWECIYRNSIGAMVHNSEIDLVDLMKKYEKKRVIMAESEKQNKVGVVEEVFISTEKKRLQRMGIFDKKLSTIENQIQILDMKLELSEYYDQMTGKMEFFEDQS